MGALGRLAMFAAGGLLGATIGGVVTVALAPQRGSELQQRVRERIERAKQARAEAEAEAEEQLREQFRQSVRDPDAFRS